MKAVEHYHPNLCPRAMLAIIIPITDVIPINRRNKPIGQSKRIGMPKRIFRLIADLGMKSYPAKIHCPPQSLCPVLHLKSQTQITTALNWVLRSWINTAVLFPRTMLLNQEGNVEYYLNKIHYLAKYRYTFPDESGSNSHHVGQIAKEIKQSKLSRTQAHQGTDEESKR